MTPDQMRRKARLVLPSTPSVFLLGPVPSKDDLKDLPRIRVRRSEAEPWLLEQLDKKSCPTCGGHVERTTNIQYTPVVSLYMCWEDTTHQWAITDDK